MVLYGNTVATKFQFFCTKFVDGELSCGCGSLSLFILFISIYLVYFIILLFCYV